MSGSPTPRRIFTASVAWSDPIVPVREPSTPASTQDATDPGGGASGKTQR
jgi:hypothetical protein